MENMKGEGGGDASNRVRERKWIGEGAPAGSVVTNRGLCARYSDTLSAILSPSVEYRTHWKPSIGSQNVCSIDRVC